MRILFSRVTFIKSAPTSEARPLPLLPEVVFIGRSNVGKSSLINALTGHRIAKVSATPGKTALLNYFLVDETFYLVDAPGYGYTAHGSRHLSSFATMMEGFFKANTSLSAVVWLLDSRHAPSKDDVSFYHFAQEKKLPLLLVLTKSDKTTQKESAAFLRSCQDLGIDISAAIKTSTLEKTGFDELKARIAERLTIA